MIHKEIQPLASLHKTRDFDEEAEPMAHCIFMKACDNPNLPIEDYIALSVEGAEVVKRRRRANAKKSNQGEEVDDEEFEVEFVQKEGRHVSEDELPEVWSEVESAAEIAQDDETTSESSPIENESDATTTTSKSKRKMPKLSWIFLPLERRVVCSSSKRAATSQSTTI